MPPSTKTHLLSPPFITHHKYLINCTHEYSNHQYNIRINIHESVKEFPTTCIDVTEGEGEQGSGINAILQYTVISFSSSC